MWQANFDKLEDGFAERLWLWWMLMQPKGRIDENACLGCTSVHKLDWGGLAALGKSEIFLVVLGLYWWAEMDGRRVQDCWREALADVAWVCEHIVEYGGLPMPGVTAVVVPAAKSTAKRK